MPVSRTIVSVVDRFPPMSPDSFRRTNYDDGSYVERRINPDGIETDVTDVHVVYHAA